jgi:hypothetical protein
MGRLISTLKANSGAASTCMEAFLFFGWPHFMPVNRSVRRKMP